MHTSTSDTNRLHKQCQTGEFFVAIRMGGASPVYQFRKAVGIWRLVKVLWGLELSTAGLW